MATVSVSVPNDLKVKMLELDDVNWSAVAKKAFEQKINDMEFFNKISNKSKLTENDAKEFSDIVSKNASKRFIEMK